MNIVIKLAKSIASSLGILLISSCSFNSSFYDPGKEPVAISWNVSEEGFFKGATGQDLNYLYIKPDRGEAIASVFILHGNDGNLASCKNLVMPFVKNGYQVFLFDYQGFGKSEGYPTHRNLLNDAETFLNYIKQRPETKGKKLLVAGFSLGGQLSIALTERNQDSIDALVVEGTFTSHKDIAVYTSAGISKFFAKILVSSGYNAKNLVSKIDTPKLIIHSSEDDVNPYSMGVALYDAAADPKLFWEIKGGHIEGLERYEEEYIQKLNTLLSLPHGKH